jgi:hypothetical protein
MPLIRVLLDSKRPGECRAPSCRAPLDWYRTYPGDKPMPIEHGAAPLGIEADAETGARVGVFDASDTHWPRCPARLNFKRR